MDEFKPAEGVVYHAGFPNAAETTQQMGLDLQRLVVRHPASTFFWRLSEAIPELGWQAGDILVVDRSQPLRHMDMVVAVCDESFVIRRFISRQGKQALQRPDGQPERDEGAQIWGVVTFAVQQMRGRR